MEKNKEKKEKKERKRRRRNGERRRRGRKIQRLLPLVYRRFDGRSLSGKELKSVYSTRPTLQEVGILPTLVYFHPKGCLAVFSALRGCLDGFFIGLPCVDPTLCFQFETGFQLGNIGNLGSCSS